MTKPPYQETTKYIEYIFTEGFVDVPQMIHKESGLGTPNRKKTGFYIYLFNLLCGAHLKMVYIVCKTMSGNLIS